MYQYFPKARNADLVVQDSGDETLVYDTLSNKAVYLNETSAMIWHECNGENSVTDIADEMGRRSGKNVNDDLVWLAINDLSKNALLDSKAEMPENVSSLSRRELIKKVGLASMIAIPVVSSLVAPMAVHANSACVPVMNGCACNDTGMMIGLPCDGAPATPCASPDCQCIHNDNGNTNASCEP